MYCILENIEVMTSKGPRPVATVALLHCTGSSTVPVSPKYQQRVRRCGGAAAEELTAAAATVDAAVDAAATEAQRIE